MSEAHGRPVDGSGARWLPIAAAIASVSVFDVALGLTYPLLSLLLAERGVPAGMIGLNAAMTPLGVIAIGPLLPRLAARLGSWRLAVAAMATVALSLVLLKLAPGFLAWCALRFALGLALGVLFTVTEAWIAALAPAAARGRVMGIYASVLSLGFAAGPFMLLATGTAGWPPFLAGLAAVALGAVPLLIMRGRAPPLEGGDGSPLRFARAAPTLLVAVACFALFDTAAMALLPLYGLRAGLSEPAAATMLGVLIVGNVLLQPLLGWIADRWSWRPVMAACAGLVIAGAAALPLVIGSAWLWPLLLAWGTAAFGVYTVALAQLGHRFEGTALVAGSAAFAMTWGLGGIVGPPVAGSAMEVLGPHALPLLLGLVYAPLFALSLVHPWPKRAAGAA